MELFDRVHIVRSQMWRFKVSGEGCCPQEPALGASQETLLSQEIQRARIFALRAIGMPPGIKAGGRLRKPGEVDRFCEGQVMCGFQSTHSAVPACQMENGS